MTDKAKICELLNTAKAANLHGYDFLVNLGIETLQDGYNGIGPEFLDPKLREKVSELLSIFEPAALGHDLRNEFSDGTREGFEYANDEFLKNCLRLADYHYCFINPRRYRARAVARILYKFVSAENFGWRAWLEAKARHEAKIASGMVPGGNKGVNMKKMMIIFAAGAAILMTGCGVKSIKYERKVDNEGTTVTSYSIYQNEHWLNTKASAIKGGMTGDGGFDYQVEGLQSSPSEEFNKTMLTYTAMFTELARIAAAAYNPSSSGVSAAKSAAAATPQATVVNVQAPVEGTTANAAKSAATAADCKDGSCADGTCTTGECSLK